MNGVTLNASSSTTVSPPIPKPAVVNGPLPAPAIEAVDPEQHEHTEHLRALRRIFVGPMPETIAVQPREKKKRLFQARRSEDTTLSSLPSECENDSSDEESFARHLGADHIRTWFLKHGGQAEDWDEHQEQTVRRELVRRWNESSWGRIRKLGKDSSKKPSKNKWTGETFEVGAFLGVKLDQEHAPSLRDGASIRPASVRSHSHHSHTSSVASTSKPKPHRADTDASFQTAHSFLPPSLDSHDHEPFPTSPIDATTAGPALGSVPELPLIQEPSASTSALPQLDSLPDASESLRLPEASKSDPGGVHLVPGQLAPTRSAMKRLALAGTPSTLRKSVVWADGGRDTPQADQADQIPAPPEAVLRRDTEALPVETSAGAAARAEAAEAEVAVKKSRDVIMRDRMLVRVQYTKVEGLLVFDEAAAHTQKDLRPEDWAEFMVVWRKNRLELYEEYATPGKEWLTGHKDLAFVIALQHADTHLSLFSPIDMSFAVTCRPRPARMLTKRRALFAARQSGTNIFVFKLKSRSRAVDWIWRLWSTLDGEIPDTVDIRAPTLGTRTRIELPDFEDDITPTVDDIVGLCQTSFMSLPEWRFLFETALEHGQRLALAWRWGTKLDWVWLPNDIEGDPRAWAAWYGVALRGPTNPTTLEMRLAQHYPTRLVLRDHTVLVEPPAVEGYLQAVRGTTRSRTYLSTHDGCIFTMSVQHANPPGPPSLPVLVDGEPRSSVRHEDEVKRGAAQMLTASTFVDMRSVICVRRAETLQATKSHDLSTNEGGHIHLNLGSNDDFVPQVDVERTISDDEDDGGEENLPTVAADKARLRMKRSFEMCLRSGQTVRYEAYSRKDALEWITRLNALISYWTYRHRIDARQEMELVSTSTGQKQYLVLPRHGFGESDDGPDPVPDPDDASPTLSIFWHWCVLENCRAIIKSGRLFMKRGLSGQYRYCNLVLVSGHLVEYRIDPRHSDHHHRGDTFNLLDTYVCSGIFATQALPRREYLVEVAPKRYQDGLEAEDSEEDTTFLLWYRTRAAQGGDRDEVAEKVADGRLPRLNESRKFLVLKTRSKLERDAWCWAINCELERVIRTNSDREVKIRDLGGLIS